MDDLQQLWDLWRDGTVDGLRRRLATHVRRTFPFASRESVFADDIVSEAFDSAVRVLSSGGTIRRVDAWFYKTARLIASKRIQEAETLQERGEDVAFALRPAPSDASVVAERDAHRTELVAQALAHATGLLPKIGTGQVRDVMELFLDAVRQDVPDFPPAAIADTLGISEAQARTLLHRGLGRLRREAERQGLTLPDGFDPEPPGFYRHPSDLDEEEER